MLINVFIGFLAPSTRRFTSSHNIFQGGVLNNFGDQINYNVQGNMVQNANPNDSNAALQILAQKAAANAFHDSEQRFPHPNCHPGTRTRILQELSSWIEDDARTTSVFWLHGSVGVGKSAIAQNLVEKYAGKRLAAAFFFSRNDSTRDKLDPFVASIVYQFTKMGSLWRVLGPTILEAIRSDPKIFETKCENQFQKLIVEPWFKANPVVWNDLPNVIAIDGLDECIHHPSQERLLDIIRKVTTAPIPVPWIFLICSRPEPQIRDAFWRGDFRTILTCSSQLFLSQSLVSRRHYYGIG